MPKENFFAGLDAATKRKKLCASKAGKFSWLRVDPCIELADREDLPTIRSAKDVSHLLHESLPFAGRGKESLMVLCLNAKNSVQAAALVHTGGRVSSIADPVSILQPAALVAASGIILAHNHPSGSIEPSAEDIDLTQRMKMAAKQLNITLLDHVILTDDPDVYLSFMERGLL